MARALVLVFLFACSTRDPIPRLEDGGPFDTGVRVPDAGAPPDGGPRPDAGENIDNVLVYAHSRDTLFSFSPRSLEVTEIGAFTLAGGAAPNILDIALDRDGVMYATSREALFRCDPMTAVLTEVGAFGIADNELNALTFLAEGELGPTEVMIGATDEGNYYRIDPASGRATLLGSYPDEWLSSGDIVSVAGLGTFATLKRSDYPADIAARIRFAADGSSTVTVLGPTRSATTNYTQLFGVAYWGRSIFGFTNDGELLQIDKDTGAATAVSTATGSDQFWGAGVTTLAPILF
jgi:hypothetical protein